MTGRYERLREEALAMGAAYDAAVRFAARSAGEDAYDAAGDDKRTAINEAVLIVETRQEQRRVARMLASHLPVATYYAQDLGEYVNVNAQAGRAAFAAAWQGDDAVAEWLLSHLFDQQGVPFGGPAVDAFHVPPSQTRRTRP